MLKDSIKIIYAEGELEEMGNATLVAYGEILKFI